MLGNAMAADTVDRNVQEWERIDAAVAFRLTNGDELLIQRRVMCPNCGHAYVFGLANGDMVSFARRHEHCPVNNQIHSGEPGLEDEEQDNGDS